jgi:hypothetical protein
MHFEAIAETHAGACVLTDASELGRVTSEDAAEGRVEDLEIAGRIFRYDPGGNGRCKLAIYVDEELPEEVRSRSERRVERLLLRIPSGRLAVCGFEELAGPREVEVASTRVAAGDYLLEAHLMPLLEEKESLGSRATGWGCVASVLAAFAGAVSIAASSWIGWVLVAVSVLYVAAITLWYNLSGERARAERREAEEPPSVVVALKRLTEMPPPDLRGGNISV